MTQFLDPGTEARLSADDFAALAKWVIEPGLAHQEGNLLLAKQFKTPSKPGLIVLMVRTARRTCYPMWKKRNPVAPLLIEQTGRVVGHAMSESDQRA